MNNHTESNYPGRELEFFAHARNWKRYWSSFVAPYLQGDILEVGAGIGTNMEFLLGPRQRSWICLEPDGSLLNRIGSFREGQNANGPQCELVQGTIADIAPKNQFDVVLYIDVLEHIAEDACETGAAAARLRPGGYLIVLSPAHNWLFSPFDAALGHHRRYTRTSLRRVVDSSLCPERIIYLDSCGLLASLCNRVLLRQSLPTLRQILFWDRVLVPLSRLLDPLVRYKGGKSILGIWTKRPGDALTTPLR